MNEKKRELAQAKVDLAEAQKKLSQTMESRESLFSRKGDFASKLADLEAEISEVETRASSAITQYARGEISEGDHNEIQATLEMLRERKKTMAAAIQVLAANIQSATTTESGDRERVQRLKESAYHLVMAIEAGKLAPALRRTYAAYLEAFGHGYGVTPTITDFMERLRTLGAGVHLDQLAPFKDQLSQEYFK
ncbi:hypothetical protein GMLC_41800 [Geomonas limicola]|uniref:Uncharacterized protein n=2 Tax=Geomonas TaxID=2651583 RepID=A0A6V8MQ19_9BACT|nr:MULTISPECIES: hypothetical protein [Geomonas]GFO62012.1 hypothetical protein GMST_43370 [Geomonas silvestris]GFO70601.1 hypothetical protein GMLC_41800 [Geomonas limicola]